MLSQAIPRLMNPEHAYAEGMAVLAVGGIIINGLAVLRIKGGKSLNVQMVTWHLLEDVLDQKINWVIYDRNPDVNFKRQKSIHILGNSYKYNHISKMDFVVMAGSPQWHGLALRHNGQWQKHHHCLTH